MLETDCTNPTRSCGQVKSDSPHGEGKSQVLKEAGDQVFLRSRDGLVAQLQDRMGGYLGKVLRGCSSSPFMTVNVPVPCFLTGMMTPCRSLAVAAEVRRGSPPSSVPVAAAARAGAASRHSQGKSMVVTDVILLPSAIHFYDILFLLGARRGFWGRTRHITC